MSVLKNNRKPSQFEVFHHAYELRKELTDLLIRDFGYKAPKQKETTADGKPKTEAQLEAELKSEQRRAAFQDWYIAQERDQILKFMRALVAEITMANSIFPTNLAECDERRLHQDRALGYCHVMLQELQFIIETLPVNVNKYVRYADSIQLEIALIKGWRKSDNKYRKKYGAAPD